MQPTQGPAYHERQRLHQCLRHSLNNLFQSSQFSSGELDAIADALAPGRPPLPFLHPHRTLVMGNYDVNVLEVALRRHGKELRWYDLRDAAFERLDLQAAWALILNVQSHSTVGRLVGGRHWLALRRFAGRWWNLDSNLPAPCLVAESCSGASGERNRPAAAAGGGAAGEAAAVGEGGSSTACQAAAGTAAAGDEEADPSQQAAVEPGATAAPAPDGDAAGQEAGQAAGPAAAAAAAAAEDEAAVRRFLVDQVQRHDAKVFVVVDSPLESHPLQDSPQEAAAAADGATG